MMSSYKAVLSGFFTKIIATVEMELLILLLLLQARSPLDPDKTKRRDIEPSVEKARYNSLAQGNIRGFSTSSERAPQNTPSVQTAVQPETAGHQNTLGSRTSLTNTTTHSGNTSTQQDENRPNHMSR